MSNSTTTRPRWFFFLALAVLSVLCRLAPQLMVRMSSAGFDMAIISYPWGFTPMLAVGLFAGAFIPSRRAAVALILGTQLLGDLGIWALSGDLMQGFDPGMLGVYVAHPLCVALGGSLSQTRSFGRVMTGSVLAATVFFLVTNFGVWAFGRYASPALAELYPLTLAGLLKCYTLGIPFAKEFIGTPLFAALLFSPLGVAQVTTAPSAGNAELAMKTV